MPILPLPDCTKIDGRLGATVPMDRPIIDASPASNPMIGANLTR